MFDPQIYAARREQLRGALDGGVVLLPAAAAMPRTYADNVYPYRQSAHLLYYLGLTEPGLFLVSYPAEGRDVLYGDPVTMDDVIWCGPKASLEKRAALAGIDEVAPAEQLAADLAPFAEGEVHYLPPFQREVVATLARLLGRNGPRVLAGSSPALVQAVAEQRLIKGPEEVAEIEEALVITARAYRQAMETLRPGLYEREIAGLIQGVALREDRQQAFQPITTIHGEVLHNESRAQRLDDGQLMLIDSGAESARGYASDITRTLPVSGRFSPRQRVIYDLVLAAQRTAIRATRPGVSYRDVHLESARVIADGLIAEGLMRGNADEAVAAGAHALFFPHGLGHALGIDVHDMEDLGDAVGYAPGEARSEQFGLAALRFARELQPGHVVTAEPGIYFVPALIDQWAAAGTHEAFIDYEALDDWRDFGGIRIEDDVLVTDRGSRVLGPPIPRGTDAVECAMES
jgi:Xaa-Pro aminopeptidase